MKEYYRKAFEKTKTDLVNIMTTAIADFIESGNESELRAESLRVKIDNKSINGLNPVWVDEYHINSNKTTATVTTIDTTTRKMTVGDIPLRSLDLNTLEAIYTKLLK